MEQVDSKKKEILKLSLEKVALQSAGVKNKYNTICDAPMKKEKDKVFYPTLYLNSREAPDLAGSEVGQEKTLVLKVFVKSYELNEREGNKNESFSLEIRKIGIVK